MKKVCKITAIVLAAGQGSRMNSSVAKQYLELEGKPLVYYSLKAFEESRVDDIILVTGKGQIEYCKNQIVELYHFNKIRQVIEGGKERYDSVYGALQCLKNTDYVLIHDGARPFITVEMINNMIAMVREHSACILATPVKETVKVADTSHTILSTPDRHSLWSAQTPQAFHYQSIRIAYDKFFDHKDNIEVTITDDSMVYELFLKMPVKIVAGDYRNIKITTPEDMIIAKALMNGN
jgi:2-C-methyl-D-erythritol 4-phosphate cytidylyltransferase